MNLIARVAAAGDHNLLFLFPSVVLSPACLALMDTFVCVVTPPAMMMMMMYVTACVFDNVTLSLSEKSCWGGKFVRLSLACHALSHSWPATASLGRSAD